MTVTTAADIRKSVAFNGCRSGLDDAFLNQIVGRQQKDSHECHLRRCEGQHGHGGEGSVNVGQHPDDQGQRRDRRQAQKIHGRGQQKIKPVQPAAPGQQRRQKGDGQHDFHDPQKTIPAFLQAGPQAGLP
jgi:hypothetical protein